MKNKKWILHILASFTGAGIYTAYLLGAPGSIFFWGTAIAIVILLVLNHIFRFYPNEHKPVREAYAEYLAREKKKEREIKRSREEKHEARYAKHLRYLRGTQIFVHTPHISTTVGDYLLPYLPDRYLCGLGTYPL